jgi:hypothetical protein
MDRHSLIILKRGLRNDPEYRAPKVLSFISRRQMIQGAAAGVICATMSRTAKSAIGAAGRSTGGIGSGFNGYYPSGHWEAAVVPFGNAYLNTVLISPRPDTETSSWAQHRWHFYDGSHPVTTRIPLIMRGGSYPWVWQIISAPAAAGASLGALIWQPNWTIAQALAADYGMLLCNPTGTYSAGAFQIRGNSQDGTYVDIEFTASTIAGYNATAGEGIIFLDPVNGTDPGSYPASGTINTYTTPIKTLAWAFGAAKTDVTYPNAHLKIFSTGTVDTFAQDATFGIAPYVGYSPMAISSVSTTANIDAGESGGATLSGTNMAFDLQNASPDLFFDNIECTGGNQASANWRYFSAANGQYLARPTFNNLSFPNTWAGTAPTDNACPIELDNPSAPNTNSHTYVGVRGCSSTNAPSTANNNAVFETFSAQYGCVELCTATNTRAPAFALKASVRDFTVQACWADSGSYTGVSSLFWAGGYPEGSPVLPTNNIEIRHCYAMGGGRCWPITLNLSADANSQTHWVYRCTVSGAMGIYYNSANGPFDYTDCAIQYQSGDGPFMINSGSGYTEVAIASLPAGVSYSGSQAAIGTSGILNSDGTFTTAYAADNGLIGAPIA